MSSTSFATSSLPTVFFFVQAPETGSSDRIASSRSTRTCFFPCFERPS
nr:hypothetical protein Iba_chr07aCG4260 [Ipomoea batatas]GMD15968.1 hypothetical protein Iba_chr07cCG4840 [Ipomoea batatas]GMD17558.1 hypothetical protein Iba_chr07dCG4740 [Ipomoea batatas]GMD18955.1 hypothetical protein Iba_chr07eCG4170 [Ipomoea batatas]